MNDIETVYKAAYQQANDEFEQLRGWQRGRVYFEYLRRHESWVCERTAWILAEWLVDGKP